MSKPKSYTMRGTVKLPPSLQIPNVHTWNIWYMMHRKRIELQIKALEHERSLVDEEMRFLREQFDKLVKNKGVVVKWERGGRK